jgi:purine-binding chemotaxis protein CheW
MDQQTKTAGKYLTFALAGEEYGLPVLKVREIIKLMRPVGVPHAPEHIRGVINLRGRVIPVIDLRRKLGRAVPDDSDRTCIIVVGIEIAGRPVTLGIIVDTVVEVLNIASDEIELPPDFGERLDTSYLQGIAKVKGAVKLLLDVDVVLSADAAIPLVA